MNSSPQRPQQQVNEPNDSYFKDPICLFQSNSDHQNVHPDVPTGFTFCKSVLLGKKVIFLEQPSSSKKNHKILWVFDLENMQWNQIKVKGSPILADVKKHYSVCVTQENQIIFCGSNESAIKYANGKNFYVEKEEYESPSEIRKGIHVERLLMTESDGMKWIQDNCDTSGLGFHSYHSSNTFGDKMYVFGGLNKLGQPINNFYEYNLSFKSFYPRAPNIFSQGSKHWNEIDVKQSKPAPRYNHSTFVHQGILYVFGGMNSNNHYFNDLWSLNLKNLTWTEHSSRTQLSLSIYGPTFLSAYKNHILIFGGRSDPCNEVFLFNIESSKWCSTDMRILPLDKPGCSILLSNTTDFIFQVGLNIYKFPLNESKFKNGNKDNELLLLAKQMRDLFQNNDFFDVKFKVEGKEIPAHKGILSSRCSYFAKLFKSFNSLIPLGLSSLGGMKESNQDAIEVEDEKYDVYYKLIEYIYCEKVEISNEIAVDLFKLSNKYVLPSLTRKCGKCLAKIINPDNFLELAKMAGDCEEIYLQRQILIYFVNYKQLLLKNIPIGQLPRFLLEFYMLSTS